MFLSTLMKLKDLLSGYEILDSIYFLFFAPGEIGSSSFLKFFLNVHLNNDRRDKIFVTQGNLFEFSCLCENSKHSIL